MRPPHKQAKTSSVWEKKQRKIKTKVTRELKLQSRSKLTLAIDVEEQSKEMCRVTA